MKRTRSVELSELGRRVAEWRDEHGGRGSRIPDELWRDAALVAKEDGVWATAKALRFNYEALKGRMQTGGGDRTVVTQPAKCGGSAGANPAMVAAKGSAGPSFVALQMGQFGGAGRSVVELTGRDGEQMRVEAAGSVDVVGLVQAFWSRQP